MQKLLFNCFALLLIFSTNHLAAQTNKIRIFQFNIWNEANKIKNGTNKIADVIAKSDADIITFSEVRNKKGDWHQKIIQKLKDRGKTYFGEYGGGDVGLISRYPVTKTESIADFTNKDHGSAIAYHITLPGNQPLIVCSAHLDYTQYALYLARGYNGGHKGWGMIDKNKDGQPEPVTDIKLLLKYNQRSLKDEAIQAFIKFSNKSVLKNIPIILAGDFNDGSHLDWTKKAKKHFGHNELIIPWQNSIDLQKSGFIDSYRQIHPDEVKYPGLTWPSTADGRGITSWTPKADERDRIDFIYYRGKSLKAQHAYIVGPREYYKKNKVITSDDKDKFLLSKLPWPSDHKGLIVDFEIAK